VTKGGYEALHYVDFTGDGWIEPSCSMLNNKFPRLIPAYSLVTAPDFYPNCDQRELMDWWLERAPKVLREFLWNAPPFTLADERVAPNLKLTNVDFKKDDPTVPRADFVSEDKTVTAIVSMPFQTDRQERPLTPARRDRHSWLPDAAAGVFAPGWDVSLDVTGKVQHLAAYGLGSPFPEDSKLCAALSTFWPAVAPDAARSFSAKFATVCPMTDEEIGQTGALPWDGVAGPRITQINGKDVVEYAEFDHVDYVQLALNNQFSMHLTAGIHIDEYVARVLAMARAYWAVGVRTTKEKTAWNVFSFRRLKADDPEFKFAAQQGTPLWRFELYKPKRLAAQKDPGKALFAISNRTVLIVGSTSMLMVSDKSGKLQPVQVAF